MKIILSALLLTAFSFFTTAQSGNKVVIGTIDTINSKILNEQRGVWVYVPNSESNDIYSQRRYPVVYLLDGNDHFFSVVGMIQQLSSVNGNTICPEMIVVGIPNTDRTRDLTPTHFQVDSTTQWDKTSGGGENFMSFIEKELMPHIDSVYPTAPYRMLIGHSLGGLTVMNTLTHHAKLFNAYVSIDPSMWWDNEKLLKETPVILATKDYSNVSLYLAIANTMPSGMDIVKVDKDTTADTKMIRSNLELARYLNSDKHSQLKQKSRYYNDDDHGAVPLIAEYDALHFLFDFHQLKLTANDYKDVNKAVISKIEKHFELVSKQFGYKVNVPENMANDFGYQNLAVKHFDEAEYLFKLNVANYPESANVYDSLGDLYDAKGDKTNAIASYKKALSIKEVSETRQKLKKLQGQ